MILCLEIPYRSNYMKKAIFPITILALIKLTVNDYPMFALVLVLLLLLIVLKLIL